MDVRKETDPSEDRREELGVPDWSPWTKDESTFDWSYDQTETCYVLEGSFTVKLPNGETVSAEEGDLVQFPEGLECTWTVERDLRKVYTFDSVQLDGTSVSAT